MSPAPNIKATNRASWAASSPEDLAKAPPRRTHVTASGRVRGRAASAQERKALISEGGRDWLKSAEVVERHLAA